MTAHASARRAQTPAADAAAAGRRGSRVALVAVIPISAPSASSHARVKRREVGARRAAPVATTDQASDAAPIAQTAAGDPRPPADSDPPHAAVRGAGSPVRVPRGSRSRSGGLRSAPASPATTQELTRAQPPVEIVAERRTAVYRIAFFGDSVSVGFGASDRRHTYVAHVSSWLRRRVERVVDTVHGRAGCRSPTGRRHGCRSGSTPPSSSSAPTTSVWRRRPRGSRRSTACSRAASAQRTRTCGSSASRCGPIPRARLRGCRQRADPRGLSRQVRRHHPPRGSQARSLERRLPPNDVGYGMIARAVE